MAISAAAKNPTAGSTGPDLKVFRDEAGNTGAETAKPQAKDGRDLKIHAARPAAKNVREVSHFEQITSVKPEDLAKDHPNLDDPKGAAKILERFKIGSENSANFAFRCKEGNHLGVFVGDPDLAISNGFKGLFRAFFGIGRLFTGVDTRIGGKYLNQGSVIDMVDKQEKKPSLSELKAGIQSGEYKLVYTYESSDGADRNKDAARFRKRPKAIVILHDYGQMLKNLREKPPAGIPKEFLAKFMEQVDKLAGEKDLQHMYACNMILVDPDYKADMETKDYSKDICRMVAECMPPQATLVFPRALFGDAAEAASKTREYTALDWRHVENKEGKWEFNQHPITMVRAKADGKKPIPPAFLALHQMHTMMQIGDPAKLDQASLPKLFAAQEFNSKVIADYDDSVGVKADAAKVEMAKEQPASPEIKVAA